MNLRTLKNKPYMTVILVAINILIFLLGKILGVFFYAKCYLNVEGVLGYGEYYRLISAAFLHRDFMHILNNMVSLAIVGSVIEIPMGHIPYGIVYLVSGIGGNIMSLVYKIVNARYTNSLGASGACFGLDGALLAMAILMPEFRRNMDPRRVFLMIIISVYSGFTESNIDNAAHIGGLLTGFVLTGLICLIKNSIGRKGSYRN